jgi:hypothetical protein
MLMFIAFERFCGECHVELFHGTGTGTVARSAMVQGGSWVYQWAPGVVYWVITIVEMAGRGHGRGWEMELCRPGWR